MADTPTDFTTDGRRALRLAQQVAQRNGRQQINTTDLLLGVLRCENTPAAGVLQTLGLDGAQIENLLVAPRMPVPFSETISDVVSPVPLIIFDENGQVILSNEAARTLLADHFSKFLAEISQTETQGVELAVGERTFLLLTGQLSDSHTIVMLQDITRLKRRESRNSSVFCVLIHDLRSPIVTVMAYADLLRVSGSLDDSSSAFVESIMQSAQTMQNILNEMLSAIRTVDAADSVHMPYDLVPLVNELVAAHQQTSVQKDLQVRAHMPDHLYLLAEIQSLRHILDTLVQPAFFYSPIHGEVNIRLNSSEGGIVLSVEDSGPPLPVETPESDLPSGTFLTGRLGWSDLAILRLILEQYNGTAEARNLPEGGVVYEVRFPAGAQVDENDLS